MNPEIQSNGGPKCRICGPRWPVSVTYWKLLSPYNMRLINHISCQQEIQSQIYNRVQLSKYECPFIIQIVAALKGFVYWTDIYFILIKKKRKRKGKVPEPELKESTDHKDTQTQSTELRRSIIDINSTRSDVLCLFPDCSVFLTAWGGFTKCIVSGHNVIDKF